MTAFISLCREFYNLQAFTFAKRFMTPSYFSWLSWRSRQCSGLWKLTLKLCKAALQRVT